MKQEASHEHVVIIVLPAGRQHDSDAGRRQERLDL